MHLVALGSLWRLCGAPWEARKLCTMIRWSAKLGFSLLVSCASRKDRRVRMLPTIYPLRRHSSSLGLQDVISQNMTLPRNPEGLRVMAASADGFVAILQGGWSGTDSECPWSLKVLPDSFSLAIYHRIANEKPRYTTIKLAKPRRLTMAINSHQLTLMLITDD